MDTKGSSKLPPSSPSFQYEVPTKKQGITYIAIKGSLYATDCSVFGLAEEEVKTLKTKYEPILNGFSIKMNVLNGLNCLSLLGYSIVSTTGEAEITWTMQKQF